MRRPVLALLLLAFLGGFAVATPARSIAVTSQTFSHTAEVGAGRTLPSGAWGYNDVCNVGYDDATHESRCSVEFSIGGILSSAKILSAKLSFNKTSGCGSQDCPIDVYFFTGNGSSDLSDVTGGSYDRTITPGFSQPNFDIVTELQDRVSNGDDYLGVRLSRASSSNHSVPDIQTFGYSSFKLDVTFIQRPVDITVHIGGSGTGTVTSNPFGIDCPGACTGTFEWLEPMSLFASPTNNSFFSHWEGGDCEGVTDTTCSFDTPPTDPDITAVFDPPIGPPISQPPGPTPSPTPPQLTPPPLPTSHASSGPGQTSGPVVTLPPAPTDIIASDGTVITPPPPTQAALASGAAPTIVGLDEGEAAAPSGGIPLPVVILLILLLGGLVGGGVYWYTKRQQAASGP